LIVQSILNAIPQVGPVFAASLTILIMTLTGNDITVVQVIRRHSLKLMNCYTTLKGK